MSKTNLPILSLAAALSALSFPAQASVSSDATPSQAASALAPTNDLSGANAFVAAGENLFGFLVTKAADGTITAQHRSHSSHASHASHRSHYSSR